MVSRRSLGRTRKYSCIPSLKYNFKSVRVTRLVVGGLRTTFPKLKSKEYTTIDADSTKTAVSDMGQHRI